MACCKSNLGYQKHFLTFDIEHCTGVGIEGLVGHFSRLIQLAIFQYEFTHTARHLDVASLMDTLQYIYS